jgi:hypothetical protein
MLSENESMVFKVELSGQPDRLYVHMRTRALWIWLACLASSVAAPAVSENTDSGARVRGQRYIHGRMGV